MSRSHLNHWANVLDHYRGAEEFISFLNQHHIFLDFDRVPADKPMPLDLRRLLDMCFDINRPKLEEERQALIDEFVKPQEPTPSK
jgi:hypothetical protein